MRRGIRRLTPVLALGAVAMMVPLAGHADHCTTKLVVFSNPGGSNPGFLGCETLGEDADARVIVPASTGFSLRYVEDIPGFTKVTAIVNGMGLVDKAVKLNRATTDLGDVVFDSSAVAFPGGRTSSGCLRVVLQVEDPATEEMIVDDHTEFYTVDSTCS